MYSITMKTIASTMGLEDMPYIEQEQEPIISCEGHFIRVKFGNGNIVYMNERQIASVAVKKIDK